MDTLAKAFSRLSDLVGVQWAPMQLPRARRLQTLGATGWICFVVFGELVGMILFFKLVYSQLWWLAVIYSIWMMNDLDICNRGGRPSKWVRNWAWWRYYRDYFPIKLVKTTDLDSSRNYLFACFPHGVVCSGIFGAFATDALGFHKLFPGLQCHLITLSGHFLVPLFRDFALSLGLCSSSQEGLLYLLDKKKNSGKCAVLLVGGAAEALDSHPGEYKINLKKRKGFIRVAIKSGAPIVPVFSFGEPDVFRPLNNPKDSWLRRMQENVRKFTGISPIIPIGRGIFQYSYGIVPLRSPITTVVGKAMEVAKNLEPTDEEVDAVHAEFTQRLIDLFETEKSKYLKEHEGIHLIIE